MGLVCVYECGGFRAAGLVCVCFFRGFNVSESVLIHAVQVLSEYLFWP